MVVLPASQAILPNILIHKSYDIFYIDHYFFINYWILLKNRGIPERIKNVTMRTYIPLSS
jgi:hypothetical protein